MESIWLIAWTGMAAAGPIGMAGAIGATRIWLGPGVDATIRKRTLPLFR